VVSWVKNIGGQKVAIFPQALQKTKFRQNSDREQNISDGGNYECSKNFNSSSKSFPNVVFATNFASTNGDTNVF